MGLTNKACISVFSTKQSNESSRLLTVLGAGGQYFVRRQLQVQILFPQQLHAQKQNTKFLI